MSNVEFGEPFFLTVCNMRTDNKIDDAGLEQVSASEEDGVSYAKELAEEHGSDFIIYRCIPLVRVKPVAKSKIIRLDGQEDKP